jgi:hypothetical protein
MNKFISKGLIIILISVIFYCVYMNKSILREGAENNITQCNQINNCAACSAANFGSGDGRCYWCDNTCVSGSVMGKRDYVDCKRSSDIEKCTAAIKPLAETTSDYPTLYDIPAGTKMTKQRT